MKYSLFLAFAVAALAVTACNDARTDKPSLFDSYEDASTATVEHGTPAAVSAVAFAEVDLANEPAVEFASATLDTGEVVNLRISHGKVTLVDAPDSDTPDVPDSDPAEVLEIERVLARPNMRAVDRNVKERQRPAWRPNAVEPEPPSCVLNQKHPRESRHLLG